MRKAYWFLLIRDIAKLVWSGLSWIAGRSVIQKCIRPFRPQFTRLANFSAPVRHFALNVVFGTAVAMVVVGFKDSNWVQDMEQNAMDWMISMNLGFLEISDLTPPFVYVDIDEETYRKWGEPLFIPRTFVAKIVESAAEGGARLILVDLDLTRPLGPGATDLEVFLGEYRDDMSGTQPHILLAASLEQKLTPEIDAAFSIRPSFLDPIVKDAQKLHWSSTLFVQDENLSIRNWRLFEIDCGEDGGIGLPSMQLAAVADIVDPVAGLESLTVQLRRLASDECLKENGLRNELVRQRPPPQLSLHNFELEPNQNGNISNRIVYSTAWRQSAGNSDAYIRFEGNTVPLVTTVPAWIIANGGSVSKELFRGRVVVLGGSHRHSNDLHLTPVGVMPGAYVIINSIVSLLTFGVVEAPPYWIAVATNLGLVILVSALLVMVRTAWVKVFFNILLVPALSWFAFKEGVWFGVAVPIISVQAFDTIYEIWDRNSPSRKP